MKFCKDCKYFNGTDHCWSPQNGINVVNGKPFSKTASYNRLTSGLCKPEGILFVPKPWWKIW